MQSISVYFLREKGRDREGEGAKEWKENRKMRKNRKKTNENNNKTKNKY